MQKPRVNIFSFEEMLFESGFLVYTNVGNSMMPFLRQNRDIIEIRPIDKKPQKYDVVLYKRGDRYILHRILRVLPNAYLIAGDHNTFVEKDVTDDMILGIMTRVIRNGRTIRPNDFFYKIYVHLWCDCYPFRMLVLKGKQKMIYIFRKLWNKNR